VVLPSPRTGDSPMEPTDPVPDPLVHLAYVADATERIELGAGAPGPRSESRWTADRRRDTRSLLSLFYY
jgi:alkanesulfonate monooxygenase SsuD/methylene tetrahydromethanopterin reductase-like flavin-dependent oxidoreductase (luciferase family)